MPVRKNNFPCGHTGKGSHCHRCAEADKQRLQVQQEKSKKVLRLSQAPIALERLPPKVADKALEIIAALEQGTSHVDFKGKRLVEMGQRQIISVPLGRNYRLICKEDDTGLRVVEALSHEEYSSRISAGGWA